MTSQITPQTLPCFVISLEQDTERRDHMHRQLDALGLHAEFVPAVNGGSLAAADWSQYDRERCLQIYGVEMMPNEIGCFLSHYRLYERVVRENLPVALIMEDDLEIRPEFPLVLEDLLKAENPRWAVVRFESQRGRLINPKTRSDRGVTVQTLREGELVKLKIHVLGLGAYLISLDGARRMLAHGRKIFMPIDQTMDRFWENGIEPYIVRPLQVRQRPELTSRIGTRAYERRRKVSWSVKLQRRLQRMRDSLNKRAYWLFH
jgi:glycosyl transferase family 25